MSDRGETGSLAGQAEPGPPADESSKGARATAAYIAEMTHELAALARAAQLEFLGQVLDMARLEAETASRQPRRRPGSG